MTNAYCVPFFGWRIQRSAGAGSQQQNDAEHKASDAHWKFSLIWFRSFQLTAENLLRQHRWFL